MSRVSDRSTNVSYNYANGDPLNPADFLQNLANLYYNPRVPVYIPQNGTNDFRFYLDLNRNGRFDDTGPENNYDNDGNLIMLTNAGGAYPDVTFEVGDPQWIGLLERPGQPYGPDNKFIARYAFLAVPIGNALDLNAIHNQIRNEPQTVGPGSSQINNQNTPILDGFYRNQGIGSWEINLASFLADVNTNFWDQNPGIYFYNEANPAPAGATANTGFAFDDARALLAYRYNNNYYSLASADGLFEPNNYPNYFDGGSVDAYSDGQLQTTFDTNYFGQKTVLPWAGAYNPDRFFDLPSDLFDITKTANGVTGANIASGNDFAGRLSAAGANTSTYNRYTFYRMLEQLGTDSTPESGKMNLNYDNIDYTNYSASATNFMPWTPIAFFTNAANRLLQAYTTSWATNYTLNGVNGLFTNGLNPSFIATFNLTNSFTTADIPVYVSNRFVYTPAVNRLLQLAANLYDATTTNYYPSVFRPLFTVAAQNGWNNVYITGYTNITYVSGTGDWQLAPPVDIVSLAYTNGIVENQPVNVYGVPWIIGAKKGFPNFNELVTEDVAGMTRRLQFTRTTATSATITRTNVMYMISLDILGGLDFWNSYKSNFMDNVTVTYRFVPWMSITNSEAGGVVASLPRSSPIGFIFSNSIPINRWPGTGTVPWVGGSPNTGSFYIPLDIPDLSALPASVYRTPYAGATVGALPGGYPAPYLFPTNFFGTDMTAVFETSSPYPTNLYIPQWGLLTTNQLQVYILDQDGSGFNHVIDYVQIEQSGSQNLNSEIFCDDTPGLGNPANPQGIWNTNINTRYDIPWGIYNQILISEGLRGVPAEDGVWQADVEAPQSIR